MMSAWCHHSWSVSPKVWITFRPLGPSREGGLCNWACSKVARWTSFPVGARSSKVVVFPLNYRLQHLFTLAWLTHCFWWLCAIHAFGFRLSIDANCQQENAAFVLICCFFVGASLLFVLHFVVYFPVEIAPAERIDEPTTIASVARGREETLTCRCLLAAGSCTVHPIRMQCTPWVWRGPKYSRLSLAVKFWLLAQHAYPTPYQKTRDRTSP